MTEKVYVENQYYKVFKTANVGIDFVEWSDGSLGYIYFEEQYGNYTEDFHKELESAFNQYLQAEREFGERIEE